jgi:hypothetical protein
MEAASSCENLVVIYQITLCNIPECRGLKRWIPRTVILQPKEMDMHLCRCNLDGADPSLGIQLLSWLGNSSSFMEPNDLLLNSQLSI